LGIKVSDWRLLFVSENVTLGLDELAVAGEVAMTL
jgi:hypothetical protein